MCGLNLDLHCGSALVYDRLLPQLSHLQNLALICLEVEARYAACWFAFHLQQYSKYCNTSEAEHKQDLPCFRDGFGMR